MRSPLAALLIAVSFFFSLSMNAQSFKEPDFAYPKTVESKANALLASADRKSGITADVTRLRATLELCAAQTSIDSKAAYAQPAFIAGQAAKMKGAPRALMLALEASALTEIYTDDRWRYDRVDAPVEPLPADVALWSGLQFRTQIDSLLRSAAALAIEAPSMPLKTFQACISQDDISKKYFPTVADFVLWQGYILAQRCGSNEEASYFRSEALKINKAGSDPWFFWISKDMSPAEMWKTYCEYSNVEGARYLLGELGVMSRYDSYYKNDLPTNDEFVDTLQASLRRFPKWYNNGALKNNIHSITAPSIQFEVSSMVAPGKNIDVKVKYDYAQIVEAALYAVPFEGGELNAAQIMRRKVESSDIYRTNSRHGDAVMHLQVPAAGKYVVVAKCDGIVAGYQDILCTPLLGLAVSGTSDAAAVAVDFTTGMPMQNIAVKELSHGRVKTPVKTLGTTDKNGVYSWKPSNNNYSVGFGYDGLDYTFNGNIYVTARNTPEPREETNVNVLTDRALYHAGETISWAVVAARRAASPKAEPAVLKDETLFVKLYNNNNQLVAADTVTTDGYGRATGGFETAKDQLTGYYAIRVYTNNGMAGFGHVMVSDFKLPTFEAEITGIERDVPVAGSVRISGRARTYTGMPVAGASVAITLTGANRWRWFAPAMELAKFNTTTDAAGAFSFDMPVDSLKNAENGIVYNNFIVDVTVTSLTAETAAVSKSFTIGKPYTLQLKNENITADTSNPVDIYIDAFTADGGTAGIGVRWQLGRNDDNGTFGNIVAEGNGQTGKTMQMQLSDMGAGAYTLRILPDDAALADTVVQGRIVLYNIAKNQVPSLDSAIFLPERKFTATGQSVEIPVGIDAAEAYLYIAVGSGEKLVAVTPKTLSYGFHNVVIPTPDISKEPLNVRLFTVLNGKVYVENVEIKAPAKPVAKIEAESFRDRLVSGARETWRFRLSKDNQPLPDAAMIATMYNKAIESLQSYPSPALRFYFSKFNPGLILDYVSPTLETRYYSQNFKYEDPINWRTPDYRFKFPKMRELFYSMESTTAAGAMNSMPVKQSMMIRGTAAKADMAMAEEEEAVAEIADEDGGVESDNADNFDYRVAEQLQIFWKPSLVADPKGNIDLVFEMPNAIGSWIFRAMAWTPELESASYFAECMSNKPVMVQPSLPRFLRQGDKAVLPATVYNNTEESAVIETVVELFDLANGKTTSKVKSTDKIAAGASAVVKIDIDVAADASGVGYRVRSCSGGFSDGEQTAIPVLPSSATVIESTEFYLNPGDETFNLTIPAREAADASLTLQYCQNPVWTIVKAMRGLSDGGRTSTGNAGALFSALAGRYITETNPAIADALKQWKANPSEEALVSMLAKNEELKKLMLTQTPWVSAANSQTARMQALSELLDPDVTAAAIDKCVAELAKLQQADGGFAWGSWSERSSAWCTETVLTTMGLANSLGMLPADNTTLDAMLDKAYQYLQKEAVRPNAPEVDRSLALIAALYPSKTLTPAARELVRATVAYIAKNWRDGSTIDKAYDIIVLSANARPALCSEIFESIRQFGVEQPGRGLCFPNVSDIRGYATIIQAYKTMKAPDAEIDAMRQWILVRAQATDDLGAYNPDYIIASVLLTGSDWTAAAVEPAVKMNGKPLAITAVERSTGYFSQTLTAKGHKNIKLEISTNGVTPSYGSVVSIRRMPMAEIDARPGADISINKRVLVDRDGKWVETNEFALGERVRVQLTIQTKRALEYLTINDERPAAFQPVDQLPGYVWAAGTAFYRENLDATTNLFIGYLPAGSYYITYDMTAATAGSFISGIATAQSQYAPEITAHSGAAAITVK